MNPKPRSLLIKISEGLPYLEKSFSTSSSEVPAGRLPTNSRLRCVYVFSPGFLKLVRSMVRPASEEQQTLQDDFSPVAKKEDKSKASFRTAQGAGSYSGSVVLRHPCAARCCPFLEASCHAAGSAAASPGRDYADRDDLLGFLASKNEQNQSTST